MGVTIKVGTNNNIDMTNYNLNISDVGDVRITSYNSSSITGYVGGLKVVIKGQGFTYDDDGLTGGTVTGFEETYGGTLYSSISGLMLSIKALVNLAENGSVAALQALVRNMFSGADDIYGSDRADVVLGYAGHDELFGKRGDDTLYGGKGDDKITGGIGADSLFGEAGKDSFVYTATTESNARLGIDTIFDFSGKGGDRIDLSAIDANAKTAKNDAFVFIGAKAFSGVAGELRFEKTASDTYVHADTNGDKVVDFTVHLDDAMAMSKGFFVL